jgi:hypothetical protein
VPRADARAHLATENAPRARQRGTRLEDQVTCRA